MNIILSYIYLNLYLGSSCDTSHWLSFHQHCAVYGQDNGANESIHEEGADQHTLLAQ